YGARGASVGRVPYRVESAWEGVMDRRPLARFFRFTPAAEAVELASRAFPIFRPKSVLVDEKPLLRPPVDPARSEPPLEASWGAPAALAALAALLFAAPLALRRSGGARTLPRSRADVALAIAGLRKSFGDRAVLDGVDLELRAGRSLV